MATLHVVRTADAADVLLAAIRTVLDDAFGDDFSADDWDHTLGGWHVVVDDGGVVVAHAAVVARVLHVGDSPLRTGYVEGVGTSRGAQRRGHGSRAMAAATDIVRAEFELGALSTDLHAFYEALGWERWRGPTFVRDGGALVRTEDEDDAVMVLRSGASAGIDVTSAISCEARPGDDW